MRSWRILTVVFGVPVAVAVALSAVLATLTSRAKLAASVLGWGGTLPKRPQDFGLDATDVEYRIGRRESARRFAVVTQQ